MFVFQALLRPAHLPPSRKPFAVSSPASSSRYQLPLRSWTFFNLESVMCDENCVEATSHFINLVFTNASRTRKSLIRHPEHESPICFHSDHHSFGFLPNCIFTSRLVHCTFSKCLRRRCRVEISNFPCIYICTRYT